MNYSLTKELESGLLRVNRQILPDMIFLGAIEIWEKSDEPFFQSIPGAEESFPESLGTVTNRLLTQILWMREKVRMQTRTDRYQAKDSLVVFLFKFCQLSIIIRAILAIV